MVDFLLNRGEKTSFLVLYLSSKNAAFLPLLPWVELQSLIQVKVNLHCIQRAVIQERNLETRCTKLQCSYDHENGSTNPEKQLCF